jgi:hypothetical protein
MKNAKVITKTEEGRTSYWLVCPHCGKEHLLPAYALAHVAYDLDFTGCDCGKTSKLLRNWDHLVKKTG